MINNGELTVVRTDGIEITNQISGNGRVTMAGSSNAPFHPEPELLVLSGANSYSGGTFFNAGTIRVSADNNLGAATGGLTFNGGALQFGAASTSPPRARSHSMPAAARSTPTASTRR